MTETVRALRPGYKIKASPHSTVNSTRSAKRVSRGMNGWSRLNCSASLKDIGTRRCPEHECYIMITAKDHLAPCEEVNIMKICSVIIIVSRIMGAICLVVGIPSASLAFLTTLSMNLTSSSLFMICLAVSDIAVIVLESGMQTVSHKVTLTFMRRMFGTFSYFIIVLIAFERCTAVKYPWLKRNYFTLRFSKLQILGVMILWIILWGLVVGLHILNITTPDGESLLINIFRFGLPMPFIMTFNTLTVLKVQSISLNQQTAHQEQQKRADKHGQIYKKKFSVSTSGSSWSSPEAHVIVNIVVTTLTFFVLNSISFYADVRMLVASESHRLNLGFRTEIFMLREAGEVLALSHHTLTFYLYILGTKRSREQFRFLWSNCFLRWVLLKLYDLFCGCFQNTGTVSDRRITNSIESLQLELSAMASSETICDSDDTPDTAV